MKVRRDPVMIEHDRNTCFLKRVCLVELLKNFLFNNALFEWQNYQAELSITFNALFAFAFAPNYH